MTILVSKDGKKWINRSSQITDRIANINFTTETYGEGGDVLTFATSERWPSENELLGRPFRLRAVGFGNGKFVAVGDCGVVVSSNDGDDWITLNNVTTVQLNGIAWAVSNFVVVGEQGTILTSPDGNFWIRRKSGTKESLSGVAYGNGVFVAVGDNSTILTSADGIEWVPQSIQLLAPIGHIAFGNGLFLIAGENGYAMTLTSKDAKKWEQVESPGTLGSLAFGNGQFIVGVTGSTPCYSRDGHAWTPPFPKRLPQRGFGVSFANGLFITTDAPLATSTNGNNWEPAEVPPSRLVWGVVTRNDRRNADVIEAQVADFQIDRGSHEPLFYYPLQMLSPDGTTWMTPDRVSISGNVCGHELFYRTNGTPVVLSSEDGIKWTRLQPRHKNQSTPLIATAKSGQTEPGFVIQVNGRAYRLDLPIAVGQTFEVQASVDLRSWVSLTTLTNCGEMPNFIDLDASRFPVRFYRLKLKQ